MESSIRRARTEDADAIARVQVASWRSTYAGIVPEDYLAGLKEADWAQRWRDWFLRDMTVFVTEDEAGVFGFVCGGPNREQESEFKAELYAIYLLEDRQGVGVGRALVGALVQGLGETGFGSMVVWVLERNPAVAFYKRLGGLEAGRKQIEIGGAELVEIALGWSSWDGLLP